jgi:hypothetical protein
MFCISSGAVKADRSFEPNMKNKRKTSQDKLVTIATFNHAEEANLSKAKLESEGIGSFVADEFTAKWVIPIIAGGIKLQVTEPDVAEAIKILHTEQSE